MTIQDIKSLCISFTLSIVSLVLGSFSPGGAYAFFQKHDDPTLGAPTQEFHKEFLNAPMHNSELLDFLRPYKVVIIRGIFTNIYGGLSERVQAAGGPLPEGFGNPFYHEQKWLQDQDIDVVRADIHSEESSTSNGEVIAKIVRESDKKVILVSHSKGGSDTLFGLVNNPEIHANVAGWLILQAPIYGSPLVDCMVGCPFANMATRFGFDIFQGNYDGLKEVTTESLKQYHRIHKTNIQQILETVPTLSMASTFKTPGLLSFSPINKRSAFEVLNRFVKFVGGGENDGMSPIKNACLDGTECVRLKNFDHGHLVVDLVPFKGHKTHTRRAIFSTLLTMLKKRMINKISLENIL